LGLHPLEAFAQLNPETFLLPKTQGLKFHARGRFPTIVTKVDRARGGDGVGFFNVPSAAGIEADIIQEYIIPEVGKYRLLESGGEVRREYFDGERVCDIRCFAMYLHHEDPVFMGCYKRWAGVNLPATLAPGVAPDNLRKAYLTNGCQGGLPGHIEKDETERIRQVATDVCRMLKKTIEQTKALPETYI
jgi:hypothetical protein